MNHLNICITDRCNQDCVHCYVNPTNNSEDELEKESLIEIIKRLINFGLKSVHIFGGEPFLRTDLKEICQELSALKIRMSIATNGTYLYKESLEWIKQYNISLTITLNGTEIIHDRISNNPGSYKKIIENIKNATILNTNLAIATCINRLNFNNYDKLLGKITELGIKKFLIIYFSPIGRGIDLTQLILSNKEWEKFILKIQEVKNELYPDLEILYEPSIFNNKFWNYNLFKQRNYSCHIKSKEIFVLDYNGDLYPCFLLLRDRRFLLGNIKTDDIETLYKCNLDEIIIKKLEISEECLNCSYYNVCKGGCPAYKDNNYLDFRCDPNKKKYIPCCPFFTKILY
ncbi:MAG: radical SAM protein [Candidatus Lokiarchaeota archaeon]|nr:radical SAM protein [Candidatus Lokiarchaeota archaeon]